MEKKINHLDVIGWNIDADPENEPTYPMKKYTGDDHLRSNYQRPIQQEITAEEYHSNERPSMSAVFGTSMPPSGLSGAMRKYAFKYSENHYAHWLTLMMADRVNVIEGVLSDLMHLRLPNIFAEKGMKAQWKYDRKVVVRKAVIAVAVTIALIWWRKRKREHRLS
jgi:hypothetical protein